MDILHKHLTRATLQGIQSTQYQSGCKHRAISILGSFQCGLVVKGSLVLGAHLGTWVLLGTFLYEMLENIQIGPGEYLHCQVSHQVQIPTTLFEQLRASVQQKLQQIGQQVPVMML